ncbi:preprotein translocase subunit SecE [Gordonia phthalatica]|uniref:Protein translocase subunit SecE n=1 Tax=Gordonia phthalatica TaxID=1136941 RepID=A0A0N9NBK9_9ACTN|nr:preprotein translocase subunit SecE [Gordonia phthalatica]ALG85812.1 preprotein translocase subunit SecE [Gordonia phthalatica]
MAKHDRKASDDVNDDREADVDVADSEELRPSGKRSARGRRSAGTGAATAVAERTAESTDTTTGVSRNPFVRIWIFLKQVVSEMRKVVWPTRNEVINYSIAVFVFVVLLTALISGLDIGFAKLTLLVFG